MGDWVYDWLLIAYLPGPQFPPPCIGSKHADISRHRPDGDFFFSPDYK